MTPIASDVDGAIHDEPKGVLAKVFVLVCILGALVLSSLVLTAQLARVQLVEQCTHDENVEQQREMNRWIRAVVTGFACL